METMVYRAVNGRCAVDVRLFNNLFTTYKLLVRLSHKGFTVKEVDMVNEARNLMVTARYRFPGRMSACPDYFDCSSFIKYLYGLKGIWLPRRSIQQSLCGEKVASLDDIKRHDLIFTNGLRANYYLSDPQECIGHVALATGEGTIIQATERHNGIGEITVADFIKSRSVKTIRRIIPNDEKVFTVTVPADREVETGDDIKWIILQS